MKTYAYGFPRLGRTREYKKVIEDYRAPVQMIVSPLFFFSQKFLDLLG